MHFRCVYLRRHCSPFLSLHDWSVDLGVSFQSCVIYCWPAVDSWQYVYCVSLCSRQRVLEVDLTWGVINWSFWVFFSCSCVQCCICELFLSLLGLRGNDASSDDDRLLTWNVNVPFRLCIEQVWAVPIRLSVCDDLLTQQRWCLVVHWCRISRYFPSLCQSLWRLCWNLFYFQRGNRVCRLPFVISDELWQMW